MSVTDDSGTAISDGTSATDDIGTTASNSTSTVYPRGDGNSDLLVGSGFIRRKSQQRRHFRVLAGSGVYRNNFRDWL